MMSGNVAAIANTSGKHCSMKMCPFKAVNPSAKATYGALGYFRLYLIVGGMPAAVSKYMSRNR